MPARNVPVYLWRLTQWLRKLWRSAGKAKRAPRHPALAACHARPAVGPGRRHAHTGVVIRRIAAGRPHADPHVGKRAIEAVRGPASAHPAGTGCGPAVGAHQEGPGQPATANACSAGRGAGYRLGRGGGWNGADHAHRAVRRCGVAQRPGQRATGARRAGRGRARPGACQAPAGQPPGAGAVGGRLPGRPDALDRVPARSDGTTRSGRGSRRITGGAMGPGACPVAGPVGAGRWWGGGRAGPGGPGGAGQPARRRAAAPGPGLAAHARSPYRCGPGRPADGAGPPARSAHVAGYRAGRVARLCAIAAGRRRLAPAARAGGRRPGLVPAGSDPRGGRCAAGRRPGRAGPRIARARRPARGPQCTGAGRGPVARPSGLLGRSRHCGHRSPALGRGALRPGCRPGAVGRRLRGPGGCRTAGAAARRCRGCPHRAAQGLGD